MLRGDAEAQLRRQQGLRLFKLKIRPSYISTVEEADASLGTALRAQMTAGQADVLGLYLQAEPRNLRARLAGTLQEAAIALAGRPTIREEASRFLVKGVGANGRVNQIDVLSDSLISRRVVPILPGTSRHIAADVMYVEIERAHRELEQDLAVAASLGGDLAPQLPVARDH